MHLGEFTLLLKWSVNSNLNKVLYGEIIKPVAVIWDQ